MIATALAGLGPLGIVAHGIGGVQDLPVPTWLFYWAGAIVLTASFVLLGALWRPPVLARHREGRPSATRPRGSSSARWRASRRSSRLGCSCWSSLRLSSETSIRSRTSLRPGSTSPSGSGSRFSRSCSETSGALCLRGGPSRTRPCGPIERTGREARPFSTYPEQLGRWPAAATLLGFTALELAYSDPSSPRALAFAIALYTYVVFFGMASFGRDSWEARGEGFAVAFSYFAGLAPLDRGRRQPAVALARHRGRETRGSARLDRRVSVLLGSVMFDGYSRTAHWQDWLSRVEGPYLEKQPGIGELLVTGVNILGLVCAALLVGLAFRAACALAGMLVSAPRDLAPEFLMSLVPIAFAYLVAHYFSLFAVQGQFLIPLFSDPLGRAGTCLERRASSRTSCPSPRTRSGTSRSERSWSAT